MRYIVAFLGLVLGIGVVSAASLGTPIVEVVDQRIPPPDRFNVGGRSLTAAEFKVEKNALIDDYRENNAFESFDEVNHFIAVLNAELTKGKLRVTSSRNLEAINNQIYEP